MRLTLATSKYGSHMGNPLPMRSIAALLIGVCKGRLLEPGAITRYAKALPETHIKFEQNTKIMVKTINDRLSSSHETNTEK